MPFKNFETQSASNISNQKIDVVLHNLKNRITVKKISVPTLERFELLEIIDFVRCVADVHYTDIYLKNSIKITVSRTLKSFEELLEPGQFYRVHNSHLINLRVVKNIPKAKVDMSP